MAKFTFPIPGRSKKAAQPTASSTPAEPMSKAHRILGSTQLSVDSRKQWDDYSNSGISVSVSESTATASTSKTGSSGRRTQAHRREWGDDSEVMPDRLLRVNEEDAAYSDYSGGLREQPSSSTIKSWYDRTSQPLSVSQQTSASAMAKGPPSKAQRLLDMDNKHTPPISGKSKKKPAKLDLASNKKQDWDGPVLGNDYVTRSPSILSPLTPGGTSKRPRRRIQKRPTQESLRRQQEQEERPRPGTSESQKLAAHGRHDDLPSLYKHYEQMSFAQMMDEQDEVQVVLKQDKYCNPQQDIPQKAHEQLPSTVYRRPSHRTDIQGPLSSHPTLISHSTNSSHSTQRTHPTPLTHPTHTPIYPTQIVQAPTPTKMEHSPTDYATSVSSRHTRTSKASKRTEKSFQTADLAEKSILMLSSDSEEEDDEEVYDDTRDTISAAPTPRPASITEVDRAQTSVLDDRSSTARNSTLTTTTTQTTNRMSSAPAGFLTIPTRLASQSPSPVSTPSTGNLRESTQWGPQTFHIPPSPSDASLSTTVSSASTAMTWQEREGYGVQEARAVSMVPAQGPGEPSEDYEATDSDLEYDNPQNVVRESQLPPPASTAEPTPPMSPLSPSSMEFYIHDPQPMSMDAGMEHMMGLTRQEQMLIQALRQRRETMRQTNGPGASTEVLQHRPSIKGHKSNSSEATITESSFNFGFPAPPGRDTPSQASMVDIPIPGDKNDGPNRSSCTADGTHFVLSPPPTHHKTKSTSNNSIRSSRSTGSIRRSVRQSVQHPPPGMAVTRDDGMQPLERTGSKRASSRDSLLIPKPRSSLRRQRLPSDRLKEREVDSQLDNHPIAEDEITPLPVRQKQHHAQQPTRQSSVGASSSRSPQRSVSRQQPIHEDIPEQDVGVPRPDSPISPMAEAFPAVPGRRRTQLNQGARLSAFGPPQSANGELGWWGDED